jgi:2-phosphoglycerate kinase
VSERRHREPLPLGGEDGLPFSKGLLARALIATGVPSEKAYELALTAEADLAAAGGRASSLERLHELAVGMWGEDEGAQVIRRLRLFNRLDELDLPVVLLIGGATGTGKSTVATEIAYRLGITRVTSTDFVRQTMRAFFSNDFMPAIHYSSFEAGASQDEDDDDRVLHGFLAQTRNVLVGVRAAIDRVM